jgi:hypothetical protein
MRGGTEMFSLKKSIIGFRPHARALAATGAALALALLGACASPAATPQQATVSNQKIGDICEETMSFDVSGFYYPKCVDYLSSHAQPRWIAGVTTSKEAEYRACSEVGLEEGSPEYQSCVQEMYQLDLGATHL